MTRKRRSRKGYALAELILGAAIVAAFIARVYMSYFATHAADQYENFVTQVNLVAEEAIAQTKSSPDYSSLNDQNISGNLPNSMIHKTGDTITLVSSYRAPITVKAIPSTTGGVSTANTGFEIDAQIPPASCFKLAMAAPEIFTQMAADQGGTLGAGTLQSFPFTNETATTLCGSVGDLSHNISIRLVVTDRGALAAE